MIEFKEAFENIGKKCKKKSNKPFKSGNKINTIKGVNYMTVPTKDKIHLINKVAYTFLEDDSLVCAEICEIIEEIINLKN